MNVGITLLHIDCATRTEKSPAPPKMQLLQREHQLFGCCPACSAWIEVTMTPLDLPPVDNFIPIPLATGV